MPGCAVLTCTSNTEDIVCCTPSRDQLLFHPFPKDVDLKRRWIELSGAPSSWQPSKKSVVCSRHFRDCDYIVKRSGGRYLRPGAIPTEFIVYNIPYEDEDVNFISSSSTMPSVDPSPLDPYLAAPSPLDPYLSAPCPLDPYLAALSPLDPYLAAPSPEATCSAVPSSVPQSPSSTSSSSSSSSSETSSSPIPVVESTTYDLPAPFNPPLNQISHALKRRKVQSQKAKLVAEEKVKEAKLIESQLKNDYLSKEQKASAIIHLQNIEIIKLKLEKRRQKQILSRIHNIVRNVKTGL